MGGLAKFNPPTPKAPIGIDVKYLQNYLQNYLNPPIFEAGILAGSRYFPGIYQVFIRYSSAF